MRAIDFGTSSTAAAQRIDGGDAELVTFRGNYAFPSCIATHEGELVCGEEAEGILPGDPAAGTRVPKLILAENGTAYLGGRRVPVEEIIAPILREADGGDAASVPGPRILTHPANWEPQSAHCAALLDAAMRAGLDDVELISEPEAVAWHLAERLAEGTAFAVFDLGGGTCDIAALDRVHDGFDLLARPRAETIGGELANALLTELVLERLDELDEEAADALRAAQRLRDSARASAIDAETLAWLQCLIGVERQIRFAKTRPSPRVRLPLPMRGIVEITQAELSERMRPHLERAAAALGAVLDEAGLDPATTPVMLSGAASVMPDVAQTLHEKCGVTVKPVRPAKGAVALGALAALEARRAPKSRSRVASDAPSGAEASGRSGAKSKESARRGHQNITELVRDSEWEDAPERARAWLLDALLDPSGDEEFAFFTTDVGLSATAVAEGATVALVVTTDRVLWASETASGQDGSGEVRFVDASDVVPLSSEADGLVGLRIDVAGDWTSFRLEEHEDDAILEWVDYIAKRLPRGRSRDGGALLVKVRELLDEPVYLPDSILHAVVTAVVPEEIVWLQMCNDTQTFLLTTSERLVWARGLASAASEARFADMDKPMGLSTAETGLYGFRVVVGSKSHDFPLWRADQNIAYIAKRRGQAVTKWVTNVAKLRDFPDWARVDGDARDWIEHEVVGTDEELLSFAYCSYVSSGLWMADLTKTTGLLLTSRRAVWARVGAIAGLSGGAAPIAKMTGLKGDDNGVWFTVGGKQHGFLGFPAATMMSQMRARGASAKAK